MTNSPNPFNPRIPANPQDFIGRGAELGEFLSSLKSTKNRSPMSLAVVGNRGIGKSSFLAKCEQIAKEQDCMVIRFSTIEGGFDSIEDLCGYLLTQLQGEIIKRSKLELIKGKSAKFFESFEFTLTFMDFGVKIGRKQTHAALQMVFREKLQTVWEKVSDSVPAIVLLIDEAEIIETIPGALMFLREVFSRLGEERCGYMLVLSGKLAFPEEMVERFSPLARFFHPVQLKNLSAHECALLLKTKLEGTGVVLDDAVIERITKDSEGHPYVLVAIAYILYENLSAHEKKITLKLYGAMALKIAGTLDAEFFGIMYRKARPVGKEILKEIARQGGEASFSAIFKSLKKSKGTISPVIAELMEQGTLVKKERGRYELFHGLFKDYLLRRVE
jgi:hypothetical protein